MPTALTITIVLVGAAGTLIGAGSSNSAPSVTASELRPPPAEAGQDRGKVFHDGCLVRQESNATKRCVYGDRSSQKELLLFGDSEAMQFFPPLLEIAQERGWRLLTRLRAGCAPMDVRFSFRCDLWRRRTLRLIARRDRPRIVVVTGGVAYRVVRNGKRLSSKASRRFLLRGWVRTLRRLRRSGAQVFLIKDTPRSPRDVPECVLAHPDAPGRCDFSRQQPTNRLFDRKAARRVRGATLLDPTGVVCPGRRCPVTSGAILAYRDHVHFTATFAATLASWLGERLPR